MPRPSRLITQPSNNELIDGLSNVVENAEVAESRVNNSLNVFAELVDTSIFEQELIIDQADSEPVTAESTLNALKRDSGFILELRRIGNELFNNKHRNIKNLHTLFSSSEFSEIELLKSCKSIIRVMGAQNEEIFRALPTTNEINEKKDSLDNAMFEEIQKFVNQPKSISNEYIRGDVDFAIKWLDLYKNKESEEAQKELKEKFNEYKQELSASQSVSMSQLNLIDVTQLNTSQILAYSAFALGIALLTYKPVIGFFVLACSNSKHDIINKDLQPAFYDSTPRPRIQSLFQIFHNITKNKIIEYTTYTTDKINTFIKNILSREPLSGARDMLIYSSKLMISCIKPHVLKLKERINKYKRRNRKNINEILTSKNTNYLVGRALRFKTLKNQIEKDEISKSNTEYEYPNRYDYDIFKTNGRKTNGRKTNGRKTNGRKTKKIYNNLENIG